MPGEMNTNLKVEDLQMDVMITETYPGKGVLALANVKIGNFVTIRNVRIKRMIMDSRLPCLRQRGMQRDSTRIRCTLQTGKRRKNLIRWY